MFLTHAEAKTMQYKLNRFATWKISFCFFSNKFFCSFNFFCSFFIFLEKTRFLFVPEFSSVQLFLVLSDR